jgi:hypothetical protein
MTRDEFRLAFDKCFLCGQPGTDVHEIARGPFRAKAMEDPSAWLKVCGWCHENKFPTMTIARQLALKMLCDPENYDRQKVNLLRKRQPDAVTEREVAREAHLLLREGLILR